MRTRTRPITWEYLDSNGVRSINTSMQSVFTDPNPGPGPCYHVKSGTFSRRFKHRRSPFWYQLTNVSSFVWENDTLTVPITHAINSVGQQLSSLDWDNLPTSTAFGLIQFFAELDDTLAMFTRRFWSSLSYGSMTWGVLPFVSELRALLEALRHRFTDLSAFSYEDQASVSIPSFTTSGYGTTWGFKYTYGSCTVRKTGTADMSFQDPISILLDRIGFHPDLATVWDLVPLSFVVDYLFPIGDLLDNIRPGGWVQAVYFRGWTTVKLQYQWEADNVDWFDHPYGTNVEVFLRSYKTDVLTVQPDNIDLELPSFRELFNMLYLVLSRAR